MFFFAPFFQCRFGLSNIIDFYGQSISKLLQLLFVWISQIINAPFLEGAKDRDEDKESPNSCTVVESGLDEIPSTLVFNFQMLQVKDMDLPNSCTIVVIG
jgi:hypothetical protein